MRELGRPNKEAERECHTKGRMQHPEFRIQNEAKAGKGHVAPVAGAVSFRTGTVLEPGLSGFKRAECRNERRICARKSLITRLTRFNPVQPARFLNKETMK